jgi:hypothetical protein
LHADEAVTAIIAGFANVILRSASFDADIVGTGKSIAAWGHAGAAFSDLLAGVGRHAAPAAPFLHADEAVAAVVAGFAALPFDGAFRDDLCTRLSVAEEPFTAIDILGAIGADLETNAHARIADERVAILIDFACLLSIAAVRA